MIEGWNGDDYLILFEKDEIQSASERYAISEWLPGYEVVGLRGWDEFIVRDSAGQSYSVPTVPALPQYLAAFTISDTSVELLPDSRYHNRIKWYVKPIVFGGDANPGENLIWVTHEQHAKLVKFWNKKYREPEDPPR